MAKYELEIDDDLKEMCDLLIEILKMAKGKAELNEYLGLLPKLMGAVEGYDKAFASMSSSKRNANIAFLLHELAEELASDEPSVEAPPAE